MIMRALFTTLLIAFASFFAPATFAQDQQKLFVNLTTDDPWRAQMALSFSEQVINQGNQVTIWLNHKAVRLAVRNPGEAYQRVNQLFTALIKKGAQVIVCPQCMKAAGVRDADLIEGARIGKPDTTIPALFQSDRTLSW